MCELTITRRLTTSDVMKVRSRSHGTEKMRTIIYVIARERSPRPPSPCHIAAIPLGPDLLAMAIDAALTDVDIAAQFLDL